MYGIISILISVIAGGVCMILFNMITAFTASILGDNTPKEKGFLSINPVKQLEPVGFILYVFFGYGWTNSVEVRSGNFKNRKQGTIVTYITPILICILIAELIHLICNVSGGVSPSLNSVSGVALSFSYTISTMLIKLSVFNIIPVYPLWGSYILKACLSPNAAIAYAQKERIIQIIIVFMVLLSVGTGILDNITALLLGW